MKKIIIFCLLVFLQSKLVAQEKDTINWISFEQLSDSLNTNPKKVILFFHTDWCAYCRKMQNEIFTSDEIVRQINSQYYAVRFDAESTDTVYFDNQAISNPSKKKRTGEYHDIARLLAARNDEFVFPTTLILEKDFTVKQRYFEYLDRKKLLKALQ